MFDRKVDGNEPRSFRSHGSGVVLRACRLFGARFFFPRGAFFLGAFFGPVFRVPAGGIAARVLFFCGGIRVRSAGGAEQ